MTSSGYPVGGLCLSCHHFSFSLQTWVGHLWFCFKILYWSGHI